jgi:hypothetical protein
MLQNKSKAQAILRKICVHYCHFRTVTCAVRAVIKKQPVQLCTIKTRSWVVGPKAGRPCTSYGTGPTRLPGLCDHWIAGRCELQEKRPSAAPLGGRLRGKRNVVQRALTGRNGLALGTHSGDPWFGSWSRYRLFYAMVIQLHKYPAIYFYLQRSVNCRGYGDDPEFSREECGRKEAL